MAALIACCLKCSLILRQNAFQPCTIESVGPVNAACWQSSYLGDRTVISTFQALSKQKAKTIWIGREHCVQNSLTSHVSRVEVSANGFSKRSKIIPDPRLSGVRKADLLVAAVLLSHRSLHVVWKCERSGAHEPRWRVLNVFLL